MTEPENYNPSVVEPKWQQRWEEDQLYRAAINKQQNKHYALTMLPYPSGDLHIGHWYAMTPSDARARFMRMRGFNVMFPIGFDAFGLPAENAAIRRGIHPKEWTYKNIENMRRQLRSMGAMFDWKREAVSSDPGYYRWSQWFFLQLYKHNLTYRKKSPVDWCPNCNTTLAREQVWGDDRHCERCDTQVIKKDLEQWFFRTTQYADELLDFSMIDWPDRVKVLQENWIGRSEGANVNFKAETGDLLEVFTTRPDTLWGATFLVLAPEHPIVHGICSAEQQRAVDEYIQLAVRQSEIQREATEKEKTGIFTGAYAINPVNGARIPIWIADYVLITYGTGAIMGVPAHDERDFSFAIKYGLPIIPVIERPDGLTKSIILAGSVPDNLGKTLSQTGIQFEQDHEGNFQVRLDASQVPQYVNLIQESLKEGYWVEIVGTQWLWIFDHDLVFWNSVENEKNILERCKELNPQIRECHSIMEMLWDCSFYRDCLFHTSYGTMIHSGELSGTVKEHVKVKVIRLLQERGAGKGAIVYRLRDWLISRQRYWGAPIPMVYCADCGWNPVPESQLPVLLPDVVEWKPTGESPLKLHPTWKQTTCPDCGKPAERETDTMDTFMCSSWYHLRYLSPAFDNGAFDPSEYDYWMPVDTYTGGIEHATMHLIYTRFFHKACRDMGITTGPEPMIQLRNQGMVLGEDHEKMSKSRGNVIAPDNLVMQYGADTVRAYLMFFARWDMGAPWNSSGIEGTSRWLRRVWSTLLEKPKYGKPNDEVLMSLRRKVHLTLQQLTHDFETFEFNTIVSGLMELLNEMVKARDAGAAGTNEWKEASDLYLRMLAPVAPHIAEEIWHRLGKPYSIHQQKWPDVDPIALKIDEITIVLQVNGKVRDRIQIPINLSEMEIKELALSSEAIQRQIAGKLPKKVIFVPGKLINIVL